MAYSENLKGKGNALHYEFKLKFILLIAFRYWKLCIRLQGLLQDSTPPRSNIPPPPPKKTPIIKNKALTSSSRANLNYLIDTYTKVLSYICNYCNCMSMLSVLKNQIVDKSVPHKYPCGTPLKTEICFCLLLS